MGFQLDDYPITEVLRAGLATKTEQQMAADKLERLTAEWKVQNDCIADQHDTIRTLQAKVDELEGLLNDPVRLRERIQMMLDIEALAATEQGENPHGDCDCSACCPN